MMKTCSKCRSQMNAEITEVNFDRKGLNIRVKNVAGNVCPQCGHKTIAGDIALYIDNIVQAIFTSEQPIRVREVTLEAA